MTALRQLIGMPKILFGIDFPFGRSANIAAGLVESGVFTADELKLIDEIRLKILPKWAKKTQAAKIRRHATKSVI